jgi:hypothetical protein
MDTDEKPLREQMINSSTYVISVLISGLTNAAYDPNLQHAIDELQTLLERFSNNMSLMPKLCKSLRVPEVLVERRECMPGYTFLW